MVKKPGKEVVSRVQGLYRADDLARRVFDALAARTRDATATSIENIMRLTGTSRAEAVAFARKVHDTGAAEFYLGRRGSKSRLVWKFSCISVGQAATGEVAELEEVQNPEPEPEDSASEANTLEASSLTIAEAKRLLAQALGLEPSNIEISIRA